MAKTVYTMRIFDNACYIKKGVKALHVFLNCVLLFQLFRNTEELWFLGLDMVQCTFLKYVSFCYIMKDVSSLVFVQVCFTS